MKLNTFIKTNAMAIVAIIFAGSLMSFKVIEKKVNTFDQIYFYDSSNMAEGEFRKVGNWNLLENQSISCETTRVRPCKITVHGGQTLSGILGSKNNSQVLDISEGFQPEP